MLGALAEPVEHCVVERQVRRWTTQWEKSKTRELPEIDEVRRRLADHLPE